MLKKNGSTLSQAALMKLKSSGLTAHHAQRLGITFHPDASQLHPSFHPLPALRFTYLDFKGQPLCSWPKHPPFYRIRYLATPNDFTRFTEAKAQRYAQEPESGVAAYFPQCVDWPDLTSNPARPLLITEGELKAAKACVEGFPTIGLGGVYNFRSARRGVTFLRELNAINWVKRHVAIVYDSDYRHNPAVCKALTDLAEELYQRGALPHVVALPEMEEKKTGLDDFLAAAGTRAFSELLETAEPLTLAAALFGLNERVVYVRNPGLIVDLQTFTKHSPNAFTAHAFSTESYAERTLKAGGSISLKRVAAAERWLRWPLRHEVASMTYRPGAPRVISGSQVLNLWPGWGVESKKGRVEPFLRLVEHLFHGAEPGVKDWFLDWCAYPLQYPGVKLFTSVAMHGIKHGTGKSLIGYTLGRIYGRNFTEITQNDLHSNFNEWAEGKQFVLADDVTGGNQRRDADLLKKLVTQKELRVNPKYVPSYVVPDCINYFFTSNHPDAFFLEDDDRRFFIHEITVGPLDEVFYADYDIWLAGGGAAAVFAWLLARDVSKFNPAAPALRTRAKDRMIADVKSDLGSWVERLRVDPDALLRVGDVKLSADLYTNAELLALYDPTGKTGTTANGLGRELKRSGFRQARNGSVVNLPSGAQRLYIVRNLERWINETPAAIVKHLKHAHEPRKEKF